MSTRNVLPMPEAGFASAPDEETTTGTSSAVTVDRLAAILKWTVLAAFLLTVGLYGWFTWVLPGIARSDAAAKTIMVQPFTAAASDSLASAIAERMTVELPVALKAVSGITVAENRTRVTKQVGGPVTAEEPEPEVSSGPPNLLVEGAVTRVGDRIRVSLKMTNTRREIEVWSRVSEFDAAAIPVLPADYARLIADEIQHALVR